MVRRGVTPRVTLGVTLWAVLYVNYRVYSVVNIRLNPIVNPMVIYGFTLG